MPDGKPKKQKNFRLSETAREYITSKADEWNLNDSEVIERIIREHKQTDDETLDAIADAVINKFDAKYGNLLTRIRMSSNFADRNVQIMLEAFNSLLYDLNVGEYMSFSKNPHSIFVAGTRNVQERLADYRNKTTSARK